MASWSSNNNNGQQPLFPITTTAARSNSISNDDDSDSDSSTGPTPTSTNAASGMTTIAWTAYRSNNSDDDSDSGSDSDESSSSSDASKRNQKVVDTFLYSYNQWNDYQRVLTAHEEGTVKVGIDNNWGDEDNGGCRSFQFGQSQQFSIGHLAPLGQSQPFGQQPSIGQSQQFGPQTFFGQSQQFGQPQQSVEFNQFGNSTANVQVLGSNTAQTFHIPQTFMRSLLEKELNQSESPIGELVEVSATIPAAVSKTITCSFTAGQRNILLEKAELENHSPNICLNKLADVLFRPGMKYCGTIRIPGLGQYASNGQGSSNSMGGIGTHNPWQRSFAMTNDGDDDSGRASNSSRSSSTPNANNGSATSNDATSNDNAALTSSTGDQNSENLYEFVVLERGEDALGNSFIFAQHRAYEDEQSVDVRLKFRKQKSENHDSSQADSGVNKTNGDETTYNVLEIEYADGETVCNGIWNPKNCRFEGSVRQRSLDDGFFHQSDSVSHVFTLYPCTFLFPRGRHAVDKGVHLECSKMNEMNNTNSFRPDAISPTRFHLLDLLSVDTRAFAAHRHRTFTALFSALHNYNEICQVMEIERSEYIQLRRFLGSYGMDRFSSSDEKFEFLCQLKDINWNGLATASSMYVERMCAEFRRRAAILNQAIFETNGDRKVYLKKWEEARMNLSGSHSDWTRCESLARNVNCLACTFNPKCLANADHLIVMHGRLAENYSRLDKAFRGVNARLPTKFFLKYELPHTADQVSLGGETNCPICQSSLLDSEEDGMQGPCYKLPCSHSFHGQCIQHWCRDHSSCPICRFDFLKEIEGDAK